MEGYLKLLIGVLLLALSLGYLYRPAWVIRFNAIVRSLFEDAFVLHYRRRWGLGVFVAAVLFVYSGFSNLSHQAPPAYTDMAEAYRAYNAHDYAKAALLCEKILSAYPAHVHANFLLHRAQLAIADLKKPPQKNADVRR